MKEINNNYIEQALIMHKETVSPHKNCLQEILSQIPEKKIEENRRAVRSPYTWLAVTQVITLCSILLAVIPTIINNPSDDGTFAYEAETESIDRDISTFEETIDEEDYQKNLLDESFL